MTSGTNVRAWYVAGTSNGQGLVIDEATGRSVAVAYDEADAPLIAEAPAMAKALRALLQQCEYIASESPAAMMHPDLIDARGILSRLGMGEG